MRLAKRKKKCRQRGACERRESQESKQIQPVAGDRACDVVARTDDAKELDKKRWKGDCVSSCKTHAILRPLAYVASLESEGNCHRDCLPSCKGLGSVTVTAMQHAL
jgi:hypothetical protein